MLASFSSPVQFGVERDPLSCNFPCGRRWELEDPSSPHHCSRHSLPLPTRTPTVFADAHETARRPCCWAPHFPNWSCLCTHSSHQAGASPETLLPGLELLHNTPPGLVHCTPPETVSLQAPRKRTPIVIPTPLYTDAEPVTAVYPISRQSCTYYWWRSFSTRPIQKVCKRWLFFFFFLLKIFYLSIWERESTNRGLREKQGGEGEAGSPLSVRVHTHTKKHDTTEKTIYFE